MAKVSDFKIQEQLCKFLASPHLWVVRSGGKVQEIVRTEKETVVAAVCEGCSCWVLPTGEKTEFLFNDLNEAVYASSCLRRQELLSLLKEEDELLEKVKKQTEKRVSEMTTTLSYIEDREFDRLNHLSVFELRAMALALSLNEDTVPDYYSKSLLVSLVRCLAVKRFGNADVYDRFRKWWWGEARCLYFTDKKPFGKKKQLSVDVMAAIDGVVKETASTGIVYQVGGQTFGGDNDDPPADV